MLGGSAVILLIFYAIYNWPSELSGSSYQPDRPTMRTIERSVKKHLRDPDSAQFSGVAFSSIGRPVACGHVNARNAFGGYVGPMPFKADYRGGDVTWVVIAQTMDGTSDIRIACIGAGVPGF